MATGLNGPHQPIGKKYMKRTYEQLTKDAAARALQNYGEEGFADIQLKRPSEMAVPVGPKRRKGVNGLESVMTNGAVGFKPLTGFERQVLDRVRHVSQADIGERPTPETPNLMNGISKNIKPMPVRVNEDHNISTHPTATMAQVTVAVPLANNSDGSNLTQYNIARVVEVGDNQPTWAVANSTASRAHSKATYLNVSQFAACLRSDSEFGPRVDPAISAAKIMRTFRPIGKLSVVTPQQSIKNGTELVGTFVISGPVEYYNLWAGPNTGEDILTGVSNVGFRIVRRAEGYEMEEVRAQKERTLDLIKYPKGQKHYWRPEPIVWNSHSDMPDFFTYNGPDWMGGVYRCGQVYSDLPRTAQPDHNGALAERYIYSGVAAPSGCDPLGGLPNIGIVVDPGIVK